MSRNKSNAKNLFVPKWMEMLVFLSVSPEKIFMKDGRSVMGASFNHFMNIFQNLGFVELEGNVNRNREITMTSLGRELSKNLLPLILYVEDQGILSESNKNLLTRMAKNPIEHSKDKKNKGINLKTLNEVIKMQTFLEKYKEQLNIKD